jgi:hypothetical protein
MGLERSIKDDWVSDFLRSIFSWRVTASQHQKVCLSRVVALSLIVPAFRVASYQLGERPCPRFSCRRMPLLKNGAAKLVAPLWATYLISLITSEEMTRRK